MRLQWRQGWRCIRRPPVWLAIAMCAMAPHASSDQPTQTGWTACPDGELSERAPNDATPPSVMPTSPCGEMFASHYVFRRDRHGSILLTLVEGPRGPQIRSTLSYQQLKDLKASGAPVPLALRMTRAEFTQLVDQLDTVRASTEKYRDVNVALADGYVPQSGGPGGHVHFTHASYLADGRFDLSKPEMLVCEWMGEDYWQLMGVAFILPRRDGGDRHPDGFAGPLDNWHIHYNTCKHSDTTSSFSYSYSVLASEACRQSGGFPVPETFLDAPCVVRASWSIRRVRRDALNGRFP